MKTLYPVFSTIAFPQTLVKAPFAVAVAFLLWAPVTLAGEKYNMQRGGGDPVVPEAILPATLINWALYNNNNAVQLRWTTTIEKDISHFIVERSFDGAYYADDAMIVAAGNSGVPTDYRYTDKLPAGCSGIIYYRLKLVTLSGRMAISEVRVARIGNRDDNKQQFSTYPNPVVNNLCVAVPPQWQNKPVSYRLVNGSGQVIRTYAQPKAGATEIISMSAIPAGVYHLSISDGSAVSTRSVLKAGN